MAAIASEEYPDILISSSTIVIIIILAIGPQSHLHLYHQPHDHHVFRDTIVPITPHYHRNHKLS